MSYTYCTSGAIINKAGANINTTAAASSAIIQQFCDNAEGYVNVAIRYDFVANSAAISTNFKPMLAEVISSLAAIDLISYDMEAVGRIEAQARINVLYDKVYNGLQFLKLIKKPEVNF